MKLQCNVCHEAPIVEVALEPKNNEDLVLCPNCYKQLAYAAEKKYSRKLLWKALDTDYNPILGKAPVTVISL